MRLDDGVKNVHSDESRSATDTAIGTVSTPIGVESILLYPLTIRPAVPENGRSAPPRFAITKKQI
jgi:hypothetical protein